jgi:hypothetical protein
MDVVGIGPVFLIIAVVLIAVVIVLAVLSNRN